jgi:hypothetical protein
MPRPGQPDDSVQMVRHHDKRIQGDSREVCWDLAPAFLDNPSKGAKTHLISDDRTEKAGPAPSADGDEVRPFGRVVVRAKTR